MEMMNILQKKEITLGATFEPEYCEHDNDHHIYCQVVNFNEMMTIMRF